MLSDLLWKSVTKGLSTGTYVTCFSYRDFSPYNALSLFSQKNIGCLETGLEALDVIGVLRKLANIENQRIVKKRITFLQNKILYRFPIANNRRREFQFSIDCFCSNNNHFPLWIF